MGQRRGAGGEGGDRAASLWADVAAAGPSGAWRRGASCGCGPGRGVDAVQGLDGLQCGEQCHRGV